MARTRRKQYWIRFKNAFDFSRAEQRGIIVLGVILLLLTSYYFFVSIYNTERQGILLTKNPTIDSFFLQQQELREARRQKYAYENNNDYGKKKGKQQFTPFDFCPDTMKGKDWQRLGFSEKQAVQIEKYMSKGGKFYKKEDFKKIYCVSEETYEILAPYIQISVATGKKQERQEKPNLTAKYTNKIELNKADSIDLLSVPNIGSLTASIIISYRTKLGGFIHINQLKEIKYIDDERFAKIEPYLEVNPALVKKINVNQATVSILVKHPYIDYYLAKSIVAQRDKKGKYASLEEMKKTLSIYDELYQKIFPYLTVE